jgi:hypothetical protein
MGCSFTYGDGVADAETMPYQAGVRSGGKCAVYNFGYSGYGPHQMLAALQRGLVRDVVSETPRWVIYQGLSDHVERCGGAKWDTDGPWYVLGASGRPEYRGSFPERAGGARRADDAAEEPPSPAGPAWRRLATSAARTSHLLTRFNRNWRWRVTYGPEEIELYLAIVQEAAREAEALHPGCEFHVLFWDRGDHPQSFEIAQALEDRGLRVHRVSRILPGSEQAKYRLSPYNGHPNPRAYAAIAEYVAREILGAP